MATADVQCMCTYTCIINMTYIVHVLSQVLNSRLSEMDVFMHRLADIQSELGSSAGSRTAGTDGLLPQLASVLSQLQQVCHALANLQ